MPGFDRYDIISVPFPYTDRAAIELRPALVVSDPALEGRHGLLWVLMITAAENRSWQGDVPIAGHRAVGLPIPSIVRTAKIATVEASRARFRDRLPAETAAAVAAAVKSILSLG
jgi:mRNA interferase MazF